MAEFQDITLTIVDRVATITLNRPERMNAAGLDTFSELRDALEQVGLSQARALVITGSGRAFCAGADISGGIQLDGTPGDLSRRSLQNHMHPLLLALAGLDIPVVTAVNGAAAGIGCALALSGDLIVAGKSAYFLQAFVNIGLVPDGGATWLLPRVMGLPLAMEAMLLGERISAERAYQLGMVNRCVEDADVLAEAHALAARLADGPTIAIGLTRGLVRNAQHCSLAEAMTREAEAQKRAGDTADYLEGVAAFKGKRAAKFRGS